MYLSTLIYSLMIWKFKYVSLWNAKKILTICDPQVYEFWLQFAVNSATKSSRQLTRASAWISGARQLICRRSTTLKKLIQILSSMPKSWFSPRRPSMPWNCIERLITFWKLQNSCFKLEAKLCCKSPGSLDFISVSRLLIVQQMWCFWVISQKSHDIKIFYCIALHLYKYNWKSFHYINEPVTVVHHWTRHFYVMLCVLFQNLATMPVKGKGFPYSFSSIWASADLGFLAYSDTGGFHHLSRIGCQSCV